VLDEESAENPEKLFTSPEIEHKDGLDEDEAVVEELLKEEKTDAPSPKMKEITADKWSHLNARPPLWQR
jgi:heat shock protein beta